MLVAIVSLAEYPDGCVDCHVRDPDRSADFRMQAMLRQMGHAAMRGTAEIPTDCGECHNAEEPPPLGQLIHVVHYDERQRNGFVQDYGGDCLHCHAMNADEGESFVKSREMSP